MLILAKYAGIMLPRFHLKFGKNTSIAMQKSSKWQTHLPYL